MNKNIKRLCVASGAVAVATLGLLPSQQAWAISGNIEIETKKATYDKGDTAEVEITIKTIDGANFLLQTSMEWSSGLTLQSVTGDNIQYNRGKIIGTAPQPEFVITVKMKVNAEEDQTITLIDTKMGSVDGSPNHTIDRKEKILDVNTPPVQTESPTTPPSTTPPVQEPPQPSEPEKPEEPETPVYAPWKATVTVDDNLNVREGPGLNYKIIGKYEDGDHVNVTNEQKGGDIVWLKVEKGWISKDYVIEGHIERPEKTDEEIEREQQEQINNEAENAESENQANNEAAQKQDEEKKEQYDKQEQAQQTTEPSEETEEPTSTEETVVVNNQVLSQGPTLTIDIVPGTNPVTTIEGSSYVQYLTPAMAKPFYLYLESYSLQFPDTFEKTAQQIGGLDFLFAVPSDLSIREQNVFLVFGNYDPAGEPALYYFDKDSDSFFPYEKMIEKTIIVDNTVNYEKKKLSLSHIAVGILGLIGVYAAGAFTTALSIKKKEEKTPPPQPPKITHSKPTAKPKTYKPDPDAVKDMTDEELDELLKVYGASTSDMIKREAQISRTTQKIGDLKNLPKTKVASSVDKKVESTPTLVEKPKANEEKGKKMSWDTLTNLMENPEKIEESGIIPPLDKGKVVTPAQEILLDSTEAIENIQVEATDDTNIPSPEEKISEKTEALKEEMQQVAEAIAEFEGTKDTNEEEPVLKIDLKFEAEPAPEIIVDDLQIEFEKAVAEDKLNETALPTEVSTEE